jgi:hypothetical protein
MEPERRNLETLEPAIGLKSWVYHIFFYVHRHSQLIPRSRERCDPIAFIGPARLVQGIKTVDRLMEQDLCAGTV